MLYIPKFAEQFVGKNYTIHNSNEVFTAIGYGDNDAGNAFVIGTQPEGTKTIIRTHRFIADKVAFEL